MSFFQIAELILLVAGVALSAGAACVLLCRHREEPVGDDCRESRLIRFGEGGRDCEDTGRKAA